MRPITICSWRQSAMLLALGLLLLSGGTMPATGQELAKNYVGQIADTDALVAVVVAPNGKTIAYTCSDDNAWNEENSRWYTGEMTQQGVVSAATRDGKQLSGQITGDTLTGTIGGLPFQADLVTSGTAGLYRGRADDEVHAVIEALDGRRVGGVWNANTGRWGWTWRFTPAITVERTGTLLRLQRPPDAPAPAAAAVPPSTPPPGGGQQQFIFVELQNCVSSFDQCGNI